MVLQDVCCVYHSGVDLRKSLQSNIVDRYQRQINHRWIQLDLELEDKDIQLWQSFLARHGISIGNLWQFQRPY